MGGSLPLGRPHGGPVSKGGKRGLTAHNLAASLLRDGSSKRKARAQSPKVLPRLRITNRKQSFRAQRFAGGLRMIRPGDGLASRTADARYCFVASAFGFGAAAGFGFQNAGSAWITSSGG